MNNGLLLYCRRGFEKECAGEIQQLATEQEVYGYCVVADNSGYVNYITPDLAQADLLAKTLSFNKLVFARQMFVVVAKLQDLPPTDRVSAILDSTDKLPLCGDIRIETPDTNEAKELLGFCRKFTVPLRGALRKQGCLTKKEQPKKPVLHLMMLDSGNGFLGYSYSDNNSPFFMGIPRLKFPSDAPSRSTLKLEEAILFFLPQQQEEGSSMRPSMTGVDLGACPGGWTYQLVRRGLFVSAIDNGPMAQSLMDTGQVTHFMEDGFKFKPEKTVDWMICDMVEKPIMVADLMSDWLIKDWCRATIFNLKLPMKKRFVEVYKCLELIESKLRKAGLRYKLQCKHLYHDREEVTVSIELLQ
ncbi:23S rRNA (cytidine(2498)-2'-O)-methyltransferase RlmM [Psychrobium sp. 1_MG-2023]|uniref:23S rRNA (cytidine(2498)-2'-O)-methyltransferase RlmM n=1 Tax=Psychrobium sp. 1_MG-2023 TaxID=3062624 RepID=UPI000C32357A|nr:23S rRNA (cytidine(2498)-2'-O)-methyltransferase RlmM [Psychrobium sp. 1_MG-2023]MDP2560932.1 23S rRNA (cytidine(2498)-2'-O)-methyltransferase RlmM [Psychrobium sp. 1_MG-2023]PKF56004.1 23S rRNA (cytidine(2498)-2'-O)-methyltransferase RlmM [Alteromonadales bacterium alter-6D02]